MTALWKINSINFQNVSKNAINGFRYGTMASPNGDKLLQLRWMVIQHTTNSPKSRLLSPFPVITI